MEKTLADRQFQPRKLDKSKEADRSTPEKRKSGKMEGNLGILLHCASIIFKSQSNSYEGLHELFSLVVLYFLQASYEALWSI